MSGARATVAWALGAMLAVQVLVTMASLTVPVFAPDAASDFGVDPNHVGIFASVVYLGAMTGSLMSGGFILRFGAVRISQLCLILAAASLAATTGANLALLLVAAVALGVALGPTTPASSHVLARHSPPGLMSLVFSIKQTGVPLGGVMAGLLVPLLVVQLGWRGAAWGAAAICLACAIAIQVTRRRFDTGLRPREPLLRGSIAGPLRLVMKTPPIRRLALASFAYAAMQQTFSVFIVTYLVTTMEMGLVQAGQVLAIGQIAGVIGRVVWGALTDWMGRAQLVLGLIGIATTASAVGLSAFSPGWSFLLVALMAAVFGSTAIGWNGVYLAEVSRLAPDGEVGRATGGALFITFAGVFAVPPVFGLLASLTGSYDLGFHLLGVLTLVSGLVLIRGDRLERRRSKAGGTAS